MYRVQIRLTGPGIMSTDNFLLMPRVPVKGDVITLITEEDGAVYFDVQEVMFYFHNATYESPQKAPRVADESKPAEIFAVARRRA